MNARHWKRVAEALIWLLLLTMPYWLDAVGGYTQLGEPRSDYGARRDVA